MLAHKHPLMTLLVLFIVTAGATQMTAQEKIGTFAPDGSMDTCIAIRIAQFEGDHFTIRVGAGVVAGSTPEGEYKEIGNKARQTIRAVEKAAGVRK